ncbi:MAG: transposase [Fimbriimonas sp.]
MREKKHRLPAEDYMGQVCVAITACEKFRRPNLANPAMFEIVTSALEEAAERGRCSVPIYTLMPDHAHLLVLGIDEESRALETINFFKWKSGVQIYSRKLPVKWEKDFYDRIVREAEGWRNQGRYIALNPVRAGLVENPEEWPFTGSIGYNLRDVLDDAF